MMKAKIKISISLIVVAIGVTSITLEARMSNSLFFSNASAVICNSYTDCTSGWYKDASNPSACCNIHGTITGHTEGIRKPGDEVE